MRGKAILCASAAVLAALTVASPAPAAAAVVGVIEGNGTVVPALTTVSQPLQGGFAGTLFGAVVGTGVTPEVGAPCDFVTASTGSVVFEQGTYQGNCPGPVSGSYTRVGSIEVLTGGITATCLWVPTSLPDVATYVLIC